MNVAMVKLTAFGISSALAGLGGALTACKLGTTPEHRSESLSPQCWRSPTWVGSQPSGHNHRRHVVRRGHRHHCDKRVVHRRRSYTAYVAGFFLIATAVFNNEGIDGFQRRQFFQVVNLVRQRRSPNPSIRNAGPKPEAADV